MEIKSNIIKILMELQDNSSVLNEDELQRVVKLITQSNQVFLNGKGRSGLVIKAFANRLLHLGINSHIIGDISTPRANANDLLIIGSGSGETGSLIELAKSAKKLNMTVVVFTTANMSTLAKLADNYVVLPGITKFSQADCVNLQPMGSGFEQLLFITLDAIILELITVMNLSPEFMKGNHANLE
ncbi:MAG: hypothetical protein ATN34_01280 [Epulopiscium sp. Nele67-Bin002]|nr:MAG: hypothetical protein ATN34_01280 [Epulopiscium sp. Nele67-Bin002]OON92768.1 MAG: hypothetical protein ATN33_06715 [Epulopiscium sp. Nele67-Bin001]